MQQGTLFPYPLQTVADEEVIAVLRTAVSNSRGLSRMADLTMSGVCAEYLVDQLHLAGLEVVRQAPIGFRA